MVREFGIRRSLINVAADSTLNPGKALIKIDTLVLRATTSVVERASSSGRVVFPALTDPSSTLRVLRASAAFVNDTVRCSTVSVGTLTRELPSSWFPIWLVSNCFRVPNQTPPISYDPKMFAGIGACGNCSWNCWIWGANWGNCFFSCSAF